MRLVECFLGFFHLALPPFLELIEQLIGLFPHGWGEVFFAREFLLQSRHYFRCNFGLYRSQKLRPAGFESFLKILSTRRLPCAVKKCVERGLRLDVTSAFTLEHECEPAISFLHCSSLEIKTR